MIQQGFFLNAPPSGDGFSFGLEAEYLLAERKTYRPLWYPELNFSELNRVLETIPTADLPSCHGMALNPPHRKVMPYGVEGYHLYDDVGGALDLLPKGIEIRTPRTATLDECLHAFEILFSRLRAALAFQGYRPVALSHHPTAEAFRGPQQIRSAHYWPWAMQAMVTYGPDVNISLPRELQARLDVDALSARVNYYAPAMVAFSLASPFFRGGRWEEGGQPGQSVRTYRRSLVGEALELHPDEGWRLEFKPFEMACRSEDFYNQFLLWLTLLLDDELPGAQGPESRVRELRSVAIDGLAPDWVVRRANELLRHAELCLPRWGFSVATLAALWRRCELRVTPADEMLELWEETHDLTAILRERADLVPLAPRVPPYVAPRPSVYAASP